MLFKPGVLEMQAHLPWKRLSHLDPFWVDAQEPSCSFSGKGDVLTVLTPKTVTLFLPQDPTYSCTLFSHPHQISLTHTLILTLSLSHTHTHTPVHTHTLTVSFMAQESNNLLRVSFYWALLWTHGRDHKIRQMIPALSGGIQTSTKFLIVRALRRNFKCDRQVGRWRILLGDDS